MIGNHNSSDFLRLHPIIPRKNPQPSHSANPSTALGQHFGSPKEHQDYLEKAKKLYLKLPLHTPLFDGNLQ